MVIFAATVPVDRLSVQLTDRLVPPDGLSRLISMALSPRDPEVHIQLTGEDDNAFMILALVQKALREADVPPEEIKVFVDDATSGDYDKLLQTATRWVDVA